MTGQQQTTKEKPYYVSKVDGGYQIWYRWPGSQGVDRPADGEKMYPSRHNAYARCKQMNDTAMTTTVDVSLTVWRKDCNAIQDAVKEALHLHVVRIEDPLRDGEYIDERHITFSALCRNSD